MCFVCVGQGWRFSAYLDPTPEGRVGQSERLSACLASTPEGGTDIRTVETSVVPETTQPAFT